MPWNFHITRRMFPSEKGRNITLFEWARVVEADAEMSLVSSCRGMSSSDPLSVALWHGHPAGRDVRFEWMKGAVVVARPDTPTLAQFRALALRLEAHVEDDEGGWYDRRGDFLGHLAAG